MELDPTARDLSWQLVLDSLSQRSEHPLRESRAVPLASSFEEMARLQERTREALAILNCGDKIPLAGIQDIDPCLVRLERFGTLEGTELVAIYRTLNVAEQVRRFLKARRDLAPELNRACTVDPQLVSLADELMESLEPDGRVSDQASPELLTQRQEAGNLRNRITGRLDHLIQEKQSLLSDKFYTVREGRYVLPVRADTHEKVHGIVHGMSQTGATVFIEPRELVVQGNRLKLLDAQIEREEQRVLGLLSERVSEQVEGLRAAVEGLIRVDFHAAAARLASDFKGTMPTLVPEARLELRKAKHPLLVFEAAEGGHEVVPNDLSIRAGEGLVLSGPNAGGKTVGLKVLGLAAWMVRAGLPIFAEEGSLAGFFDPVLTEFGDAQSVEQNLSTFSAHVTHLTRVMGQLSKTSLVLLDEVATGTDPADGGALACAILEAMCQTGAAVVATTHYDALKAFAATEERLRNASVGFDVEMLRPTFELHLDVPGTSSALEVAGRFGLPEKVIERARALRSREADSFQHLVAAVEVERRRLSAQLQETEKLKEGLAQTKAQLTKQQNAIRAEAAAALRKETDRLRDEVSETRRALRDLKRRLSKPDASVADLRDAKAALDASAELQQRAQESKTLVADEPVRGTLFTAMPGQRVWVCHLRAEGVVTGGPDSRGRVQVSAGPIRTTVQLQDLRGLEESEDKTEPLKRRDPTGGVRVEAPARSTSPPPAPLRTKANTVDLRGLAADDAASMAETFLDRLYAEDASAAFLVHGHGDGVLRERIRRYLSRECPYPTDFRPGLPGEGGDAVTVVRFL